MTWLRYLVAMPSMRRLICSTLSRSFSTTHSIMPRRMLTALTHGSQVDVVCWGKQLILLKFLPRLWGPRLSLPIESLQKWTSPAHIPQVLGVVRHPFARDVTHEDLPLHSMLRLSDPDARHCYVSSKLFQSVYQRCLVDEYHRRDDGMLHLTLSSIPLIAYLQRSGFTLTFLPDSDFVKGGKEREGRQSTDSVLMVSPTGFEFNPETAVDNAFMSDIDPKVHAVDAVGHPTESDLTTIALHEFQILHHTLTEDAGIHVDLFEHDPEEATPDAVFPNNWFTTHAEDSQEKYSVVLYPIKCETRRRERRPEIVEFVKDVAGDKGVLDLRPYEKDGRFLEDVDLAHLWAEKMGYPISPHPHVRQCNGCSYEDVVDFDAIDAEGRPVYHTNVLMSVGTHFAIVCLEAIADPRQGNRLMDVLSHDRTVIPITQSQMSCFCGNVLELMDAQDLPVLLMSTQAFHAFTSEQLDVLLQHVSKIHHTAINTIERIGGGSVRCTIAELF